MARGTARGGRHRVARRARLRSEQPGVLDPPRLLVSSPRHLGNVDIPAVFSGLFAATPSPLDSDDTSKVVLFGPRSVDVDLFSACCQSYGQTRGRNRVFSWPHTIFLYAVLLHRIHRTEDFARRLRVLRNLVEASSNELRLEKMPALLADVGRIVVEGALEGVSAFNQAQVADERLKAELLARSPGLERSLFHLEDHPVLRGCLAAFELDETVFERRAGRSTGCLPTPRACPLSRVRCSRPATTRAS